MILDKIFHQNIIIIKKIELLLSAQNGLKNRIKMLKDTYKNQKFFDESFVDIRNI